MAIQSFFNNKVLDFRATLAMTASRLPRYAHNDSLTIASALRTRNDVLSLQAAMSDSP